MLHPFIPFITEEIYQTLPHKFASISISNWPEANPKFDDELSLNKIEEMISIITSIRNSRAKANKSISKPIDIIIYSNNAHTIDMIKDTTNYLNKFTNPRKLDFVTKDIDNKDDYEVSVLADVNIYISLADLVDKEEAKKKLLESKKKIEGEIKRSEGMLSNESFLSKAPQAKIDSEKEKYESYKRQYAQILEALEKFEK